MFNDQGVSDLGRLVYFITLPSLLFVNILREVRHFKKHTVRAACHTLSPTQTTAPPPPHTTPHHQTNNQPTQVSVERLRVLWKLPAMALLHVSSGYLLAHVLTRAFGIRGIGRKAVTLCLMFGNVGALSIAVINTLCADEPLKSMVGANCNTRGVEYISFYLIAQNILMFTWAEEIVKDHSDEEEEDDDDEEDDGGGGAFPAALPVLQGGAEAGASAAAADGEGAGEEVLGDGDVEEQGNGSAAPVVVRRGGGASQPLAIRRGNSVRFHPEEGGGAYDGTPGAPPGLPTRRGRVGSLDRPPPGTLPPPPSLASSLSGGPGRERLKRFYSQSSILDPEDINSLLSRCARRSIERRGP